MQSVGFDVGGTFTDIVVLDSVGKLNVLKILSSPNDYSDAICTGLEKMIKKGVVTPSKVRNLVHAATVATNTVITLSGAKIG